MIFDTHQCTYFMLAEVINCGVQVLAIKHVSMLFPTTMNTGIGEGFEHLKVLIPRGHFLYQSVKLISHYTLQ